MTDHDTSTTRTMPPPVNVGYAELAYRTPRGGFCRNLFIKANDREAFLAGYRDHCDAGDEVYRSIALYPGPKRCDNHRWSSFVVDMDCENDLRTAQWASVQLSEIMASTWGIDPDILRWSFSGAKGFHCIVPGIVFGPAGSKQTAAFWKCLARRFHDQYPQVDLSIYRSSALLRLNGSIHHKTGLYKVPLEYAELRDGSIEDILTLAKSPREEDVWVAAETVPKAQRWLEDAVEQFGKQSEQNPQRESVNSFKLRGGWATPMCVRRIEEGAELVDGERHEVLFALAVWYRNTGMCQQEAVDRLYTIDTRDPIHDPDFIPRAVASAFEGKGFRGCPHAGLERFCNGGEGHCVLNRDQTV